MSNNADDLGVSPEDAMRILSNYLPGQSTREGRIRLTDEIKNKVLEDIATERDLNMLVATLGAALYALATAVGDMEREAQA